MKNPSRSFANPFRPGAGHMPPYLAGRKVEVQEFRRLLDQTIILENLILTGLRGVGKTVLLETFKPLAIQEGWLWTGADLSEATSVSEHNLATRILTDLSMVTSSIVLSTKDQVQIGFHREQSQNQQTLNYQTLSQAYPTIPGLAADKLKIILETAWGYLKEHNQHGLVFAYDEAQNLADHAEKDEFPLSLLLDVFQSIQRKNIPFMLVLTGLPTLFPKLVEARTFAERMFRVVFLNRLNEQESKDAITKPIEERECPVTFAPQSVQEIYRVSGGYPYFIQFICREVFDVFIQKIGDGDRAPSIPVNEIVQKLDSDFFAGRWARSTDRQRALLTVAAMLENAESEFTVQEIVEESKSCLARPFSSSQVNQMLASLSEAGLIYKNRHGKYSFAVPLLNRFILRQSQQGMGFYESQLT